VSKQSAESEIALLPRQKENLQKRFWNISGNGVKKIQYEIKNPTIDLFIATQRLFYSKQSKQIHQEWIDSPLSLPVSFSCMLFQ